MTFVVHQMYSPKEVPDISKLLLISFRNGQQYTILKQTAKHSEVLWNFWPYLNDKLILITKNFTQMVVERMSATSS